MVSVCGKTRKRGAKMLEVIFSLIIPILLILLFTRVTYNKYVGIILTVVLMIVAFDGLERTVLVQITGIIGILLGYYLSKKPFKKTKRKWK